MVHRVIVTFQKDLNGAPVFTFHVNDAETRDIELSSEGQITWELDTVESVSGTNWPQGQVPPGIEFGSSWTTAGNSQPTLNASNIYQVNDNGPFDTHGLQFGYGVHVQTPSGQIYSTDPDVTTTPPP
jgi:hypothetical protein